LASGGRERVLDRDLDVHVAPVIGRAEFAVEAQRSVLPK
jgi:hypothetical protein